MPATVAGSRLEAMRALGLAALGLTLAALTWRLRPGTSSQDPVGEIVLGCAWLAWLVAGWLAVAIAGCALAHLWRRRSVTGQASGSAHRWVPRRLDGLVDLVISVGLVGLLLGGGVAQAAASSAARSVPSTAHPVPGKPLQWPGLPGTGSDGQRDPHPHPADPRRRQHAPVRLVTSTARPAMSTQDLVTVRRGDSLWSLAAARLGPRASDVRIAAEWPRWYAVNRHVIGPDPSVIQPGQQLRPPPSPRPTGSSR